MTKSVNSQETSKIITLESSDKIEFKVDENVVRISTLCCVMCEDDIDDTDDNIPILNVEGKTLGKIIEYCTHYVSDKMPDIQKPLPNTDFNKIVGDWYADYIDVSISELMDIINGANYMDIQPLLDLGCAKSASLIKGKTPDEIKEFFSVNTPHYNFKKKTKLIYN